MKRFTKFDSLDHTLHSVEVNTTTVCNRSCSFCPQDWGFKTEDTRDKFMTVETFAKFVDWVKDYTGRITVCGFGEPTLHPHFKTFMGMLQDVNASEVLLITNGYRLKEQTEYLGKVKVRISIYDDNVDLPTDIDYGVVDYTVEGPNEYFNNRGYGTHSKTSPCYMPSYKMFVDTNGYILPCSDNWQSRDYLANIFDHTLEEAWLDKMQSFRRNCGKNRQLNDYCKNCNVDGQVYGKEEYERLMGPNPVL
jgi:radical SAM protein with 4Fe4S-binding SPASM domain|tara:strand:+ start:4321 stop:5067 length:747 start_codon:yes stop_codon:yes gene_type:complete